MESVSEYLLAALKELRTEELETFKWYLKNHKGFSAVDLQKANTLDTVDLINNRFGPEEAVKITADLLRKMKLNQVAKDLENKHEQAQAEASRQYPAPGGAQSKPINVTSTNIVPRTRNDFLQYYRWLTLDPNTMNKHLSENNRMIINTGRYHSYPDHPDRFNGFNFQVLCRESVTGRCYWEIEWNSDEYIVVIAVSYKSISRKGDSDECYFGATDQSWGLVCSPDMYAFVYNQIKTDLPVKPSKIGVYVDFSAGTLSFYSVSDTMILIHTQHTTFTQPLYPGFTVGLRSSVKLC